MLNSFGNEPDFILSYFVTILVNSMGMELDITLMVQGTVVTGTIISEEKYLDAVTSDLQRRLQVADPNATQDVRDALKQVLDLRPMREFDPNDLFSYAEARMAAESNAEAPLNEEDEPPIPPPLEYIHLKNVSITQGDTPMNFSAWGALMRLKFLSVDGWMLGRLQEAPGYHPLDAFMDFEDDYDDDDYDDEDDEVRH